jgi:pimeloyl-ACP methyl ester carboxylesterase
MTTVAFIHGGCHGGWCFELVAPLLQAQGLRVVTPDLPCDDLEAGIVDSRDAVLAALDDDKDVVLVAHSFGGVTAPLVAEARPVRQLVMLCANYPIPGKTYLESTSEYPQTVYDPSYVTIDRDGCVTFTTEAARYLFFHDCPPDVADAAIPRLRRQSSKPFHGVTPLKAWPDVPLTFIHGRDDRLINGEWCAQWTRSLGGNYIETDTGHSPFYARPQGLADILLKIAGRR